MTDRGTLFDIGTQQVIHLARDGDDVRQFHELEHIHETALPRRYKSVIACVKEKVCWWCGDDIPHYVPPEVFIGFITSPPTCKACAAERKVMIDE